MNLWAVTLVKDEIDILEHTLKHLSAQGVTTILVADNLSTDGTWERIQELDIGCELRCTRDTEVGHYQSRKITRLAHQAFTEGADWVIPFDADELWYSTRGTLLDAIGRVRADAHVAYATLYNYHPTSNDDTNEPNPFLRIRYCNPVASTLNKVAVRRGTAVIADGNHEAAGPSPFIKVPSEIEIAHFPWRGWERFQHKVVNGHAAFQATDLPEDVGAQWRQYGRLMEEHGIGVLREIYEKWFLDPDEPLVLSPAPWCS